MTTGKVRRITRLLPGAPALWLPVDDSLITGPTVGLADMENLLLEVSPFLDAVLAFRGTLTRYQNILSKVPVIENLTASAITTWHTHKSVVASVEGALQRGADAVAAHLNFTDDSQTEMLAHIGAIAESCDRFGLPFLIIAYPRRRNADGSDDNYEMLRSDKPDAYVELVRHCVRTAAELGADAIKTKYTGDEESFRYAIAASIGVPVLAAGGPRVSDSDSQDVARSCIRGGASGICFGRKIYNAENPRLVARTLRRVIKDAKTQHAESGMGVIQAKSTEHVH
jgi:DhnA family fructose-bisphosphate aldolase class Ia